MKKSISFATFFVILLATALLFLSASTHTRAESYIYEDAPSTETIAVTNIDYEAYCKEHAIDYAFFIFICENSSLSKEEIAETLSNYVALCDTDEEVDPLDAILNLTDLTYDEAFHYLMAS